MYLNTASFKEKIIITNVVWLSFMSVEYPEELSYLRNFLLLRRKYEAVHHEEELKRERLSFCHDIPLRAEGRWVVEWLWESQVLFISPGRNNAASFYQHAFEALCLIVGVI